MKEDVKLGNPWAIYANRVKALFEYDKGVRVEYDDESHNLTIYVDGSDKAESIKRLLPSSISPFIHTGTITVVHSNLLGTEEDLFRKAFEGNPALESVVGNLGPAGDVSYALFAPAITQLYEDDTSEFDGMKTITYAELAKSVLKEGSVRISSAMIKQQSQA